MVSRAIIEVERSSSAVSSQPGMHETLSENVKIFGAEEMVPQLIVLVALPEIQFP